MKVKDIFQSKENWVKGIEAVNIDDEEVDCRDKTATKFCLLGAVQRVYKENRHLKICLRIADKLKLKWNKQYIFELEGLILAWNDKKSRRFSQVKRLVEELDI